MERVIDLEDHVFGLDGVVHGVFFADQFTGDVVFGDADDHDRFPVSGLRDRSSCQENEKKRGIFFHGNTGGEYNRILGEAV